MSSGETQHFHSEPYIQRGSSGGGQNPDPESSTDWASNKLEYDASGSGEQEEMQRESGTSYYSENCRVLVLHDKHLSFILNTTANAKKY